MSDAIDRLKNRQRPSVPERDASLTSSPDVHEQSSPNIETTSSIDIETSSRLELLVEIQTKKTTLRLEADLSERLFQTCRQQKLSREVFIEALFEYYEAHEEIRTEAINNAKKKADDRMLLANKKRARSMVDRFGT